MKLLTKILGLIGGLVPLVWAIVIMVQGNAFGPRSITSVIIGVVAIVLALMLAKSPKVIGAILVILGVVGFFYYIPSFTWTGAILVVAGILAFFVKTDSVSAAPAPTEQQA